MDDEDISPTEDLVTEERLAKGDLQAVRNWRNKVIAAVPLNLTIVKEMIRRGVFPYHYEVYGVGFLELQAAFRAPWNVRSSAVLLEQWGVGMSDSRAGDIYQNVFRKVGPKRIEVVEYVVSRGKENMVPDWIGYYKECFDKLVEVMDEEREKAYNESIK